MIRLWLDGIWTLIPGSARRFHRHRGSANPQRMPSQQSMSSKQSILIQCLHVLVCVCVCVCVRVSVAPCFIKFSPRHLEIIGPTPDN